MGEDDPKCFLDDLDVMLGCTLAFKVRTQPRNRCAFVIKVSDLPEIINYIKKLIQPVKVIILNNISLVYFISAFKLYTLLNMILF